MISFLRSY